MTSITITVSIPSPKLAHNGRVHWRERSTLVRRCRASSCLLAKAALAGEPAPKWDKATAKVVGHFPTNAFPDPMNLLDRCKAIFDGIQDAGIILDDANLWPLRPEMHKDKDRPRLEITITSEDGKSNQCDWRQDIDGNWDTSCKQCMCFEYAPPSEQGYRFCHHCGLTINFIKFDIDKDL